MTYPFRRSSQPNMMTASGFVKIKLLVLKQYPHNRCDCEGIVFYSHEP